MAHIVPFRTTAARAEEEAEAEPAGGAQIIIFPGVRRERHTETPMATLWPSGKERDVLELPE